MAVGSIFEIYLLQYGWQLYGIIWDVFCGTGLAYLPFIAVIVDNVIQPLKSQEAKSAAMTSLRRVELGVVTCIVIIMLVVSPSIPLAVGGVSATNACGKNDSIQEAGNTPFGEQFARLDGVEILLPPWFYALLSLTGGLSDAIISTLPCDPDLRTIAQQISVATITNDLLRHDVARFNQECYRPAVAWLRIERVGDAQSAWESGDLQWIGSNYLMKSFYKAEFAKSPVPGFAFDANRQSDMAYASSDPNISTPQNGYPSCNEWWSSDKNGLRARLVEEFPPSMYDRINHAFQDEQLRAHEDIMIRAALKRDWALTGNLAPAESHDQSWGEYFSSIVAGFGGIVGSAFVAPITYGVKFAAPMIQSILLMLTYMLLPVTLLFGRYEWSTVMQASVFVFGVKFWTVIWAVLDLVDNQMLGVIKNMGGIEGITSITNEMFLIKTIFDLVILSFYVAAPMFFMQMLGWAGFKSSIASQVTTDSMGQAKASGQTAGDIGKSSLPGK